jgi:cell wall-associated NlpC family hydrolase
MIKTRAKRFFNIVSMLFTILFVLSSCFNVTVSERIVGKEKAQNALNEAMSCLNRPYNWGGNGPDAFDCSGLIIWSYQQVADKNLYFQTSKGLENDIRMDDLFSYNVTLINSVEVRPGDIVFVTTKDGSVTHGGLFIEWIDTYTFLFINASSNHGEVVIDFWTLGEQIRGKWFKGFGQLIERTVI